MIIELKDIPSYPIRKLDVHIEFSETGSVSVQSIANAPDFPEGTSKDTQAGEQTPDIPQEMINADF